MLTRRTAGRHSGYGALIAFLAAGAGAIALVAAVALNELYSACISIAAFVLVLVFVPACRPSRQHLISPWNATLAFFALQLVFVPLSVALFGVRIAVLPSKPTNDSINIALLIYTLGFIACALAYQAYWSLHPQRRLMPRMVNFRTPNSLVSAYILLGVVGISLMFGSVANYLGYLARTSRFVAAREAQSGASTTLAGAAGTFLFPFLGFGLAILVCKQFQNEHVGCSRPHFFRTVFLLCGVTVAYASLSYNRGAFTFPLIALIAVVLKKGGRARWRYVVAGVSILAVLLTVTSVYRFANSSADSLNSDMASFANEFDAIDFLQVYGGAPQHLGFMLERAGWSEHLLLGRTIIPSILYPVPILGKPFRRESGVQVYRDMLNREDQIVPFQGELFLNFHIPGVIFGLAALGWVIAIFELKFRQSGTTLQMFIWQYIAVWTSFIVVASLSVISQIYIYQFWPIYAYWAVTWARTHRIGGGSPVIGNRMASAGTVRGLVHRDEINNGL